MLKQPLPCKKDSLYIQETKKMMVLKKGSRLSIQPVLEKEFNLIRKRYGY